MLVVPGARSLGSCRRQDGSLPSAASEIGLRSSPMRVSQPHFLETDVNLYSEYLDFLRSHKLLKPTLVRQLRPWACHFLCHLFDDRNFCNILEIGRSAGHSYGLLRWLSRGAHIVSVDPSPTKAAVQVAELMGGAYEFIDKKSSDAFRAGDIKGPFDFVLIDGDHTFKCAAADWGNVQDVLTPNAVVMFDNLDHGKGCGEVFHMIEETDHITKVNLSDPAVWPAAVKVHVGVVFVESD